MNVNSSCDVTDNRAAPSCCKRTMRVMFTTQQRLHFTYKRNKRNTMNNNGKNNTINNSNNSNNSNNDEDDDDEDDDDNNNSSSSSSSSRITSLIFDLFE